MTSPFSAAKQDKRGLPENPTGASEKAPAEPSKTKLSEEDELSRAAELDRAERIETRRKTIEGKTDVRLDVLEAQTRSLDKKTPELINSIKPNESPEKQQSALDALYDVSVVMLAKLFSDGTIAEIDMNNFQRVRELGTPLAHADSIPAKNAALHKLREFADRINDPNAKSAKWFIERWPAIIRSAQERNRDAQEAASVTKDTKLKPEEKWTVKGWVKENPKTAAVLAIAGAVGAFFAIRGICRWLSGHISGDEGKMQEKPRGITGWVKWIVGGGLAAFVLGGIFGFDKTVNWIKGLGESVSDAWHTLTGSNPELERNRTLYEKMSMRISGTMAEAVEADFLAELGSKKYKDIVEEDGIFAKYLLNPILESSAVDAVAQHSFGFIHTKEQRRQASAVRSYLRDPKRQEIIKKAGIEINKETTLTQVLAGLNSHFNAVEAGTAAAGAAAGAAAASAGIERSEIAPEISAETAKEKILPYLREHYGEISDEDYEKVIKMRYKELKETGRSRDYVRKFALSAREAGSEVGLTMRPEDKERDLIEAGNIIRRFLHDNRGLIAKLDIPEGATVGAVLLRITESGKPLASRDFSETMEKGLKLTDEDIEGIEERDELAKKLPTEKFRIYTKQRGMLLELVEDNTYIKLDHANKMIAAGTALAAAIRKKAIDEAPNDEERRKMQRMASDIEHKTISLSNAVTDRTNHWKAYTAAVRNNWPEEKFHEYFGSALQANFEQVAPLYANLEDEISEKHELRGIGAVAIAQLPRIAYIRFKAPLHYREWLTRYWGMFGMPTAAVARIRERLTRPRSGSRLTELRLHEADSRIRFELGGGDKTGAGSLQSRAAMEMEHGAPEHRLAKKRLLAEQAVLEHDEKMLQEQLKSERLEDEIKKLRNVKSRTPAQNAHLKHLEDEATTLKRTLTDMHIKRTELDKKAISEAASDFYRRVSRSPDAALNQRQWLELDDLARRGAAFNRDAVRSGETLIQKIAEAQRRGASEAEMKALRKTFEETVAQIPLVQKTLLGRVFEIIKDFTHTRREISGAARATGELAEDQQEKFRHVIAKILHQQQKGGAAKVRPEFAPTMRISKGKIVFYTLTLAVIAGGSTWFNKDERTTWVQAGKQAALDMMPLFGTASDFYTAYHGKEKFTGRKVTGYERYLMRPLFGLLGAGSDALLIAGVGLWARGGLTTIRGGMEAARIGKLQRGAIVAASRGQGIGAREAVAAMGRSAKETAGEIAGRAAEATARAREEGGRLMAALRKFSTVGTVATIGLGVGGLALNLVKTDEIEVPPEVQQLGVVENLDAYESYGEDAAFSAAA